LTKHNFQKYLTPTFKLEDFKDVTEMKKMIETNGGYGNWLLKTTKEGGYGDIIMDEKFKKVLNEFSAD